MNLERIKRRFRKSNGDHHNHASKRQEVRGIDSARDKVSDFVVGFEYKEGRDEEISLMDSLATGYFSREAVEQRQLARIREDIRKEALDFSKRK